MLTKPELIALLMLPALEVAALLCGGATGGVGSAGRGARVWMGRAGTSGVWAGVSVVGGGELETEQVPSVCPAALARANCC